MDLSGNASKPPLTNSRQDAKPAVSSQPPVSTCPKCGRQISASSRFCNYCGYDLSQPVNAAAEVAAESAPVYSAVVSVRQDDATGAMTKTVRHTTTPIVEENVAAAPIAEPVAKTVRQEASPAADPKPAGTAVQKPDLDSLEKLKKAHLLYEQGILDEAEYKMLKARLIDKVATEQVAAPAPEPVRSNVSAPAAAPAYYGIAPSNEPATTGMKVLSFLIPLVGLILFLIDKDKKPVAAKEELKFAGIGFGVGLVLWMILWATIFSEAYYYYLPVTISRFIL